MIRLRCPDCHQQLDEVEMVCSNGHRYHYEDGVLILLSGETGQRIKTFNQRFIQLRAREQRRLTDENAYPDLPYNQEKYGETAWRLEWRLRKIDLEIISKLLHKSREKSVLEVGAWNGWLSHRLAALGHWVTAIDYFIDEFDGLAAKKFYPSEWQAIQMDLEDLSVLDTSFDVVILNRCLQYFTRRESYLEQIKRVLKPDGLAILTGLLFFRDPQRKIEAVADLRIQLNQNGIDFFKPIKGYLDQMDRIALEQAGVQITPYPQLLRANLKSWLVKTAPLHCYGLYRSRG